MFIVLKLRQGVPQHLLIPKFTYNWFVFPKINTEYNN